MSDDPRDDPKLQEDTRSAKAKLTNRQRAFVENYVREPISAAEAARRSYNVTTDRSAQNMGSKLLQQSGVRAALQEMFAEHWPESEYDTVLRLRQIINHGKDGDSIAAIKELAKMKDYYATRKSANITVDLNKKFSMPED